MAGTIADRIIIRFSRSDEYANTDYDGSVAAARDDAVLDITGLRNAIEQFNTALNVSRPINGGEDKDMTAHVDFNTYLGAALVPGSEQFGLFREMLEGDFSGNGGEWNIDVSLRTTPLTSVNLNNFHVTRENMDSLTEALNHAAREAIIKHRELLAEYPNDGQGRHMTDDQINELRANVELRARQVLQEDLGKLS